MGRRNMYVEVVNPGLLSLLSALSIALPISKHALLSLVEIISFCSVQFFLI